MIVKYSFPSGRRFSSQESMVSAMENIVETCEFEILEPGTYNVSPGNLPDYPYDHKLFVLSDGTAEYRVFERPGWSNVNREHEILGNSKKELVSGEPTFLPIDESIISVGLKIEDGKTVELFQLIIFVNC